MLVWPISFVLSLVTFLFLDTTDALSFLLTSAFIAVGEIYLTRRQASPDKQQHNNSAEKEQGEKNGEEMEGDDDKEEEEEEEEEDIAPCIVQGMRQNEQGEWTGSDANKSAPQWIMGKKKVTLEQMENDFMLQLRQFWHQDEADFAAGWRQLEGGQRWQVLGMLVTNFAKGSEASGFAIPEGKHPLLVPEFAEEKLKKMSSKPVKFEDFIAKRVKGKVRTIDEDFVEKHKEQLQGLVIKTGASLYHEVPFNEEHREVFVVVRGLLIAEVLVTAMELVLGRKYNGTSTGRTPLASKQNS